MTKNGLNKAKEFYQQARVEFQRAKQKNSDVLFRDAAEKGWNAVVLSTNALVARRVGKAPKSNRERREKLFDISAKNGKVVGCKFYEWFMARMDFLHRDCFYDGIYTEKELLYNLQKVKDYLRDVERAVK